MDQPSLALLNAAHKAEETKENFHRELDADLETFHCPTGEFPDDFQYDGFVVTGSRASVYWDREWIGQLKTWVGDAAEAGLPGLGVCFGHQLLADVLGGRVEGMGEYELGYRTIEQDGKNRLLEDIDETLTVFTSHSDHVREKPPGATVFARNEYGIQGFRKHNIFAVQFHPEYDMETARMITKGKSGDLSPQQIDAVLDGIHSTNYEAACEAKQLFDNFLSYVRDIQEVGRVGKSGDVPETEP
ncbi:glutamine amidotransferase (homolog to GMP synthase subunit A) (plasmid) [Natronomonas pharaonis DSM 2160]|uniref:Glutamine amidotransferase (Homolog to GMP synthase subunit A) n=1 Tax=Natronomonas pharaonis (strain ATCC 35678 / DSM 2160 / CIP 103997 / JCM 8858 / NBRC 14720 / NCIMB 2260 / Gabara) TaxID=348780 RepID=Q3ILW2_NATPD|nr:GMP synthase [Natronomonas pharaonis]CAI50908.1 glutamine amidotransferase (homolog to GMP synthase subunit A) [Natronomonas pharaonis DSM 2160]